MTKVEKVKKLMEKYGLKLSDLEDVEDEEEKEKPTEPKEEVKVDKVEEPKETEKPTETETENKVEETKEPVENGTTEESKSNDIYKTQFEEFNKQLADLKALVEAQAAKTDKAYEMLDAQGKAPSEEDNDFEIAKKLGYRDIQPNIADEDKSGEEFAKTFQTKKIR